MIKKILVAIDGSNHAEHALNFALDLADRYSAEIQLLTVVPPVIVPMAAAIGVSTYPPPVPPVDINTYSKGLKASHEKVLAEALNKAKKVKPNLKASTKLVEERRARVSFVYNKDLIVLR